jgi:hypothetical protein
VIPAYESFKNSPVARIRNKKLSLGSNDSFYDQPYSSVDELGTGFSSFTPPPPPDFRSDDPYIDSDTSPADPPQEFTNQLYDVVHDQPQPELSDHGYAEPEIKSNVKPEVKSDEEPEAASPPPPYFPSGYASISNEGYDIDEELDKYLAEQEAKPKNNSKQKRPSRSPASSTGQSVSPTSPSRGSPEANVPEVVYAQVDKSKKKNRKKGPSEEPNKVPYDAVVVYDERTNL